MREGTSLPSPPLLFIAFFTSHRSPLSERLEQASVQNECMFFPRDANSASVSFLLIFSLFPVKGTVSRNSAKLGNYKMPVKLRETYK